MKPDPYILLAKKAVETFVKKGKVISPPDNLPAEMLSKKSGVFVSLHTKGVGIIPPSDLKIKPAKSPELADGLPATRSYLRGCIGTYLPLKKNIALEIIKNSIDSATSDPRFPAVKKEELATLIYSVDILSAPKKVKTKKSLNPKKYGLLVKGEMSRQGLLLPDIEGVALVEDQIAICCKKAGILPNEKITLYRFTTERHK